VKKSGCYTPGKDSCWIVTHLPWQASQGFKLVASMVVNPDIGRLRGSKTVTAGAQIESEARSIDEVEIYKLLFYSNLQWYKYLWLTQPIQKIGRRLR